MKIRKTYESVSLEGFSFIQKFDFEDYDVFYVLQISSNIVAIAVCGKLRDGGLEIWKIEVESEHRGQGFAQILVDRILRDTLYVTAYCINQRSLGVLLFSATRCVTPVEIIAYSEDYRAIGFLRSTNTTVVSTLRNGNNRSRF